MNESPEQSIFRFFEKPLEVLANPGQLKEVNISLNKVLLTSNGSLILKANIMSCLSDLLILFETDQVKDFVFPILKNCFKTKLLIKDIALMQQCQHKFSENILIFMRKKELSCSPSMSAYKNCLVYVTVLRELVQKQLLFDHIIENINQRNFSNQFWLHFLFFQICLAISKKNFCENCFSSIFSNEGKCSLNKLCPELLNFFFFKEDLSSELGSEEYALKRVFDLCASKENMFSFFSISDHGLDKVPLEVHSSIIGKICEQKYFDSDEIVLTIMFYVKLFSDQISELPDLLLLDFILLLVKNIKSFEYNIKEPSLKILRELVCKTSVIFFESLLIKETFKPMDHTSLKIKKIWKMSLLIKSNFKNCQDFSEKSVNQKNQVIRSKLKRFFTEKDLSIILDFSNDKSLDGKNFVKIQNNIFCKNEFLLKNYYNLHSSLGQESFLDQVDLDDLQKESFCKLFFKSKW